MGIAEFQMNANYLATQKSLLRDVTVVRATQTEICGTDQDLVGEVTKAVNMEVPVFEKEIQVAFGEVEKTETQTETGKENILF